MSSQERLRAGIADAASTWSVGVHLRTIVQLHFELVASNLSRCKPHMRSKRAKWFLAVLAAFLNSGGGPMAWAHLAGAGKCHEAAPASVQMSPDCPEHHAGNPPDNGHDPAPQTLPCCAGGSCACAAPPSLPASAFFVQSCEVVIASTPELLLVDTPSTFIDDALRPPIS